MVHVHAAQTPTCRRPRPRPRKHQPFAVEHRQRPQVHLMRARPMSPGDDVADRVQVGPLRGGDTPRPWDCRWCRRCSSARWRPTPLPGRFQTKSASPPAIKSSYLVDQAIVRVGTVASATSTTRGRSFRRHHFQRIADDIGVFRVGGQQHLASPWRSMPALIHVQVFNRRTSMPKAVHRRHTRHGIVRRPPSPGQICSGLRPGELAVVAHHRQAGGVHISGAFEIGQRDSGT